MPQIESKILASMCKVLVETMAQNRVIVILSVMQYKFYTAIAVVSAGVLIGAGVNRPSGPPKRALTAIDWFQKPDVLPTDVFDLLEFDADRHDGKLDFDAARTRLQDITDANLLQAQRMFDVLSWKAFVAINWPSKDGQPDPKATFKDAGNDEPLVWEYWKQTSDVFKPDGSKPSSWGAEGALQGVADRFKAGWKQGPPTADQGLQAFSGPLVDQDGKWLHYSALMNRPEFEYIVKNELYNLEGQADFSKQNIVSFPQGDDKEHGAIEIKIAWKILDPAKDTFSRFLTRKLKVIEHVPDSSTPLGIASPAQLSGKSSDNKSDQAGLDTRTKEYTLGMVGMHISMRTRSSPQWIWATFEQIDNTRLDPSSFDPAHPAPKRGHPSLSNPDDSVKLVGANVLPPPNDGTDWNERTLTTPVEVLRVVPPPPGTEAINRLVQAFLGSKGSVLRFYELNGTQWPTHPRAQAVPGGQGSAPDSVVFKMPGQVVPVYLVNSTMETYFQKGFQQAGSLEQDDRVSFSIDTTNVFGTESCVGCHYSAGICVGFKKDVYGNYLTDKNGRIPVYGENGHGGATGSGNFSWALQIEAKHRAKTN